MGMIQVKKSDKGSDSTTHGRKQIAKGKGTPGPLDESLSLHPNIVRHFFDLLSLSSSTMFE